MSRINFVAEQVGNTSLPGVQSIVSRLKAKGTLQPEQLVDQLPRSAGSGGSRRRHQEGADRPGETMGPDPAGIRRRMTQAAAKHAG